MFAEKFGLNYERKVDEIFKSRTFKRHKKIVEEKHLFYDNKVYIDSQEKDYNVLMSYCRKNKIRLDDYIKEMGYIRINKCPEGYTRSYLDKEEEKFILREIEELEVEGGQEKVIINKAKRNKKLPKLLKELYYNKCQLCSEDNKIAPIELIDGDEYKEYSEVHHITQLSEGVNINDESENKLDSYKNCIVVCCYHHKFLHLHHGGFKKLKNIDGKLCFVSEQGDVLEVVTNYHLKALD